MAIRVRVKVRCFTPGPQCHVAEPGEVFEWNPLWGYPSATVYEIIEGHMEPPPEKAPIDPDKVWNDNLAKVLPAAPAPTPPAEGKPVDASKVKP